MNAKELRQAAEAKLKEGVDVMMAEYILSTVRDDDDEPVTPERLVGLGFKWDEYQRWYVSPNDMLWWTPGRYGSPDHWRVGGAYIVAECEPRNMKEARELLVRCGAIKEAT